MWITARSTCTVPFRDSRGLRINESRSILFRERPTTRWSSKSRVSWLHHANNITNRIGEEDTSRRGSRTLWAHWQMQITAMTIGVPATRRPHGRWSNLRLALSNYPPLGITERWRKTPTPLPCRLTTVPRRRPNHLPPPDNPSPRPPRILGLGSENTNA